MSLDAVVVVDAPVETALDRLVDIRGMTRGDAEARMAAQVSREERLAGADFVVDNSQDLEHLVNEVERVWQGLLAARQPGTSAAP
jgi:dephospho-CoA kinase